MTKNMAEPGSCETLYMYPEYKLEHVWGQEFAIGVLEKDWASIIMHKTYDNEWPSRFVQMSFTAEEVDLIIAGLQEAKMRWETMEVQNQTP